MTTRCECCGRFIAYGDMQRGLAAFRFEPSNHFGPEVSEWTCPECVQKDQHDRDEWLATMEVQDR